MIMKATEMKPRVRYIVTKGGKDKTLRKGDHIRLESDSFELILANIDANGWLEAMDAKKALVGAEVEIDTEYYKRKIDQKKKEIAMLENESASQ